MNQWQQLRTLIEGRFQRARRFSLDAQLGKSLRQLAERENCTPGELAASLLSAVRDDRHHRFELWSRWQSLSMREQEVAALICLGYTSRQIAVKLVISPETVKSHVRNLTNKFGVRDRRELRQALDQWDFSAWE